MFCFPETFSLEGSKIFRSNGKMEKKQTFSKRLHEFSGGFLVYFVGLFFCCCFPLKNTIVRDYSRWDAHSVPRLGAAVLYPVFIVVAAEVGQGRLAPYHIINLESHVALLLFLCFN